MDRFGRIAEIETMGVAERRTGGALVLALLAAAGCGSTPLEPLPASPPPPGAEPPPPSHADAAQEAAFTPPADPLVASRDGDLVLPGVVIAEPVLDAGSGLASFSLRNEGARDLPDLILAVVFSVSSGGDAAPLRPLIETVEAPLLRGESRRFAVSPSSARPGDSVQGFRVGPGLPEPLTAREETEDAVAPGTTFLGGLLECVALDFDLTADPPRVAVSLAPRGAAAEGAALPPLECQLLLGRANRLLWTGPWILVPAPDPEDGGLRKVRWTLHGAPGVAAGVLFLRVRERR